MSHPISATLYGRGILNGSFDAELTEIATTALDAEIAHGAPLSRAAIERIACDCNISRIITDGPSQILDVGRMTRTVSGPLWNALVARDRHCTAAGCDRPPGACEAHHIWHWTNGGPTNLENLRLLCWYHRRQQHITPSAVVRRDGDS